MSHSGRRTFITELASKGVCVFVFAFICLCFCMNVLCLKLLSDRKRGPINTSDPNEFGVYPWVTLLSLEKFKRIRKNCGVGDTSGIRLNVIFKQDTVQDALFAGHIRKRLQT